MRFLLMLCAAFVLSFTVGVVVCAFLWALLVAPLYNCTNGGSISGWGFIFPGQWVHHPVEVTRVVPDADPAHPDTIRKGWSIQKLWLLWAACVSLAIVMSSAITWWLRGAKKRFDVYYASLHSGDDQDAGKTHE